MSKLSKFLSNPKLFIIDAINNKSKSPSFELVVNSVKEGQSPAKTSTSPAKTSTSPAKTSTSPEKTSTSPEKTSIPSKAKATISTANNSTNLPVKATIMQSEKTVTILTDSINPFKQYAHIIHTGEGLTHGPSHLSQWIPYFVQSQEEFLVLVRNMDLYKWVKQNFDYVAVVYAKNPIDVESILNNLAFVRGIYYLSNTGNMIHTLRYNAYQHIFLGHGDSDKSASAHKFFRVYDQIWVAGQAHIDRFKNAGFDTTHIQFIKVGRPMLSNVVKQNEKNWNERHIPRILYLPTWEGVYEEGNYSSVRLSTVMLAEIYKRFNLHISMKFHPVTGSRDEMLKNAPKLIKQELDKIGASYEIIDKLTPVHSLLLVNNIYICDISAVVSECIAANGPIFVYIPKDKNIKISQSNMDYESYAYTFSSVEELCTQLDLVLGGNDYKAEKRKEAMDYLCSIEQTKNNEFITQLRKISSISPLADNVREEIIQ